MKKAFTLLAMIVIAFSASFAQTDSAATKTATTGDLTRQVVVRRQQPVSNTQTSQQQSVQQQQTPQQQPEQKTSAKGLLKSMRGTYITFRGHAPYKTMPEFDGKNAIYWPRFGIQVGAGQAMSFFSYEGVLEYMQTIHPYYEKPGVTVTENINTLQGSVRFGLMLPIMMGTHVVLIPNVKGALGGNFSFYGGVTTQFMAGVIGGLDFGFRLGNNKMVTLGFVYEYRWYIDRSTTFGIDFLGGQLGIIL